MNIQVVALVGFFGFLIGLWWCIYRTIDQGKLLVVAAALAGACATVGCLVLPLTDKHVPFVWVALLAGSLKGSAGTLGIAVSENAAETAIGLCLFLPMAATLMRIVPPKRDKAPGHIPEKKP